VVPSLKILVFFDAVLCSLVCMWTAPFHRIILCPSVLMMEAAGSSETCVHVPQTTQHHRKSVSSWSLQWEPQISHFLRLHGQIRNFVENMCDIFAFGSFLQISMHKERPDTCGLTLVSVICCSCNTFNTPNNKFVVKIWDLVNNVQEFNRICF
jgi:hypothetical protein